MRRGIIWIAAALAFSACNDCNKETPEPSPDVGTDSAEPSYEEPFDPNLLGGWGLHVIGRDARDIYVAGGSPDRGTLLHFDGADWSPETLPDDTPLLNWIALFDDRAIAVGNNGTILANDGGEWVRLPSPTTEDLWGVWGASADDVWVVGGRGRSESVATVLRAEQGADFVDAPVPPLERAGVRAFFKVWGTASDNVYIVGQNGACLRWDGGQLVEFGVGTAEDLISLWGSGPDDIVIVGGRSNGVIAHWNGADWVSDSLAPAPGFNGVWMPAPGEFWVAGVRGLLRSGTVAAGRYDDDDTTPAFEVVRERPLADPDLHAVFGVPGYGLLAVGGNFDQPDGPYEGLAVIRTQDWQ